MSCYEKNKVIRLPFPMELCKKANVETPYDCEDYLEQLLRDDWYWNSNVDRGFDIVTTTTDTYLDYIIQRTIDDCFGEFGYSFKLSQEDLDLYKSLFDKLGVEYNPDDLRKVVYCYYNCCEPEDYYEVSENLFDDL